jgi:restriction system protein
VGAGTHWIIPLAVVVLLGAAITAYLLKVRLPRDETSAGVSALAGMSWRDFINVVLGALTRRGYSRVFDEDATRDDSEYILERKGERWLLACKHGSAFVLGPAVLTEMSDTIRLHGLAGGLLFTQGRIADDARPVAKLQRIELLDGPTLWPELRDLIPGEQRRGIETQVRQRARKQVLLVWLVVLLVAIVIIATLSGGRENVAAPTATTPTTAPPVPTPSEAPPAAATPSTPVPAVAIYDPGTQAAPPDASDPAVLERQRADIASAISTLPEVDRAIWATQSTLQVYLLRVEGDAKDDICPLIERYPALASSRVQLTPPPESEAPVRFLQCRAY